LIRTCVNVKFEYASNIVVKPFLIKAVIYIIMTYVEHHIGRVLDSLKDWSKPAHVLYWFWLTI